MIDSLEWLRPAWFLALPAGIALLWWWWRAHAGLQPWRKFVDAELLAHLTDRAPASSARLALGIAVAVLVLACAALAGPVWRAQQHDLSGRIVVLDLSPSMDAIDVAPSRLERARAAVVGLLREAAGAQLGVVVFGADAFSVAPLTNDADTLIHLLAGVAPATLPRPGSRTDLGLDMARALLKQAGARRGDVILVGDSAGDARALDAARALSDAGFPLSVLAVGTAQGGPVPLAGGAFARTQAGEIVVAGTDFAALERLAHSGGGRFQLLASSGERMRFAHGVQDQAERPRAPTPAPNARHDGGAWLALLALPFAALLFRRGWLACVAAFALTLTLPPPQAHAFDWQDLWRRADQQAAAAHARAGFGEQGRLLAKLGPDSPWHAVLLYRSGQFAEAAAQFAAHDTADAHYNRGNALALDGQLEEALGAYHAALERNPVMQDALFNRARVREELARRLAQPPGGAGQAQNRQHLRVPNAIGPQAFTRGRAEPPDSRRGTRGDERASARQRKAPDDQAQARNKAEGAATQSDDRLSADELEHLEDLLSQVPDDPRSLLANRFAQHLRMRGTPDPDTGARW
jgi:Ca-activated chloride channel family protein